MSGNKPDVTAWVLQYTLGGIVGAISGFFTVLRFDPQHGAGAGTLACAGMLILAGAASLVGDELWHSLGGMLGGGGSYSSGEPAPEAGLVTSCISWCSVGVGACLVLWFLGGKFSWW